MVFHGREHVMNTVTCGTGILLLFFSLFLLLSLFLPPTFRIPTRESQARLQRQDLQADSVSRTTTCRGRGGIADGDGGRRFVATGSVLDDRRNRACVMRLARRGLRSSLPFSLAYTSSAPFPSPLATTSLSPRRRSSIRDATRGCFVRRHVVLLAK